MESTAGLEGTGYLWCLDMEKLWPQLQQPNIYFSFPTRSVPHDLSVQGSREGGRKQIPTLSAIFKHNEGIETTEFRKKFHEETYLDCM